MKTSMKALQLSVVASLSVGTSLAIHADDTEIFTATPTSSTTTRPNILFVIDTSGSMDTDVVERVDYDPAVTYSGSCSTSRVYWKTPSGNTPRCDGRNPTEQWVSTSNFVCKTALDNLNIHGTWPQGPAAQWRTGRRDRWDSLDSGRDSYIECKADQDIGHGLVDNDNKYAADGSNGPFSTNSSQSISWTGDAGSSYTFYAGNYLNYLTSAATTTQTRLQIVQSAAKSTLDRLSNVNVGLMRFSTDADGGMVIYPMTAIETARTPMKTAIDNLNANGGTPLSETMLEAYRYWTGDNVGFGLDSLPSASVASSRTGTNNSKYLSPLGNACQKNFIVYLTDGDPTVDQAAESTIEALPNFSTLAGVTDGQCTDNGALGTEGGGASLGDGRCLDDLAKYMYQKDFYDDTTLANNVEPTENIRTYTIGFGTGVSARGLALLQTTASVGGGSFYEAADSASLTEAFNNIINEVVDVDTSFTSPAVSVNAFNRTQNLNDLFITVFKPTDTYHWPGNLKKYRLDPDGTIKDSNNAAAVDPNTGFFKNSAQSYWSGSNDGSDVELGGAANELPDPTTRNVFTDIAAISGVTDNLSDSRNAIADANTLIESADLGIPGDPTDPATVAERTVLINWTRGQDVDDEDRDSVRTEQRFMMGDPLHAQPVSVVYGGTSSSPDAVVFTANNDGYLHAIDPDDGSELWTFIPSELLTRVRDLRTDAVSSFKRYGLDGNLVAYKIDRDGDGIVESSDGDQVLLFFGMGRGGNNYYALDVTSRNSPRLLWRHGGNDTLVGLGQSWSTPVITKVLVGTGSGQNSDRLVAIFGGGYDPTQDAIPYNTDDVGNRLFMVDAVTGNLLWHAGPSSGFGYDSTANFKHAKLNNSIPADVRVIDITSDGYADRMYAADTGGRVWRFDIINGETADNLVRGGVFASLGVADGTGSSPADARRFYVAPDVSLLNRSGTYYLNIAIGSGHRGHPLNTEIHDRFYSLWDPKPFNAMTAAEYSSMVAITDTDPGLVDVTTSASPTIPAGSKGWKIELRSGSTWAGEKVLSAARTFDGAIIFSTYAPVGNTTPQTCGASAGTNTAYAVRSSDGGAAYDRDGDGVFETSDRQQQLDQQGIAPSAVVLFPTPDPTCTGSACQPPPVCLIGVEDCGVDFSNTPKRTFWSQEDAAE